MELIYNDTYYKFDGKVLVEDDNANASKYTEKMQKFINAHQKAKDPKTKKADKVAAEKDYNEVFKKLGQAVEQTKDSSNNEQSTNKDQQSISIASAITSAVLKLNTQSK